MIALDVLPPLIDPMWDTSALIDDSSRAGGVLAAFTGYRARPALLPLVLLVLYWVAVVLLLQRASRPKTA
jgi:high-affinity iron transporter